MTQIAYSPNEAAAQVGMSLRTISRAIADGELVAHNVRGTLPRILHEDLVKWIASYPTEKASA